jgi:hypothetical protein
LKGTERANVISRALEEVLAEDHVYSAAQQCLSLVPFLSAEDYQRVLAHGLAAVRQIDEIYGQPLVFGYLDFASAFSELQREIYQNLLQQLVSMRKTKSRNAVFAWCHVFAGGEFSRPLIGPLTASVVAICRDWRW